MNLADPSAWIRLHGKVAHVTGGGHGIGRGIAFVLASAGARVVVSDIDGQRARSVAEEIGGLGLELDVSSAEAVDAVISQIVEREGGLDIQVNNAGVFDGFGVSVTDFTDETWRRVTSVNLDGVFFASRAAARVMTKAGRGGRIVNISSTQAITPGAGIAYDGVKAAVAQMTRALALDLGRHRINVNAIAPGPIWTREGAPPELPGDLADVGRNSFDPLAGSVQSHLARLPYGRWGEPLDVGKAVLFLASDLSVMVNGAFLSVDGGWLTL